MVNGETNSAYGKFIVEIYDYPKSIAYMEYQNTQTIDPLHMMYASTQIFSSSNVALSLMKTGDEDLNFVLMFNTTYMTHANSRFYI